MPTSQVATHSVIHGLLVLIFDGFLVGLLIGLLVGLLTGLVVGLLIGLLVGLLVLIFDGLLVLIFDGLLLDSFEPIPKHIRLILTTNQRVYKERYTYYFEHSRISMRMLAKSSPVFPSVNIPMARREAD